VSKKFIVGSVIQYYFVKQHDFTNVVEESECPCCQASLLADYPWYLAFGVGKNPTLGKGCEKLVRTSESSLL